MVLQTLHGKVIGVIGDYFGLSIDLKFNDISEINFSVPAYDNGVKSAYYDDVQAYRMVQIDPYGIYVLDEPNISGDGIREVKEVTGKSLEWLLSSRRIMLQQATYKLYSTADIGAEEPETIMGIVHSVAPEWGIQVDQSLWNRYRTFDETDEGLLDWLSGEASKSFGCLFCFDVYNKLIHVIDAESNYPTAPIYLSYDNLIKTQDISVSTDNFFTVLSVYGADPVNIREVNPIGTNKIYNLDYFIENGDIEEPVATRWKTWLHEIEENQELYTTLVLMRNNALIQSDLQNTKLYELNGQKTDIINQIDSLTDALNITPQYIEKKEPDQGGDSGQDEVIKNGLNGSMTISCESGGEITNGVGYGYGGKYTYNIRGGKLSVNLSHGSQKIVIDAAINYGAYSVPTESYYGEDMNPRTECTLTVKSGTLTISKGAGESSEKETKPLIDTVIKIKSKYNGSDRRVRVSGVNNNPSVRTVILSANLGPCYMEESSEDKYSVSFLIDESEDEEEQSVVVNTNTDTGNGAESETESVDSTTSQQLNPDYQEITDQIVSKNDEMAEIDEQISELEAEMDEVYQYFEQYDSEINKIKDRLALTSFFTKDELDILNNYFIEDSFEDERFAVFDTDISSSKERYLGGSSGSITVSCENEGEIIKVDTSEIDPDGIIKEDLYMLTSGNFSIEMNNDSRRISIETTILSCEYVVHKNDDEDPRVTCNAYTGPGTLTITYVLDDMETVDVTEFENANIMITGDSTGIDVKTKDSETVEDAVYITDMACGLGSCDLYFTKNSTYYESYSVQKQLYDYAIEQHKNIAYPSCQFEIESGNIVFAEEFEPFKDSLKLGSGVYLDLSDGTTLTPLLLEIHLDFEDSTSFDLVFSNDYQRHDKVQNMKSIIEDARSASRTLDMSKYNYGAFTMSNANNEIQNLFTSMIDASTNQVVAGGGQSVEINGAGITVRKPDADSSTYIRINNGMISLIDETDNKSKLAIGRFYDSELGIVDGIAAPNVVGSLIAGESAIIKSSKTFGGIQAFRVDGDGVALANGRFDLYKALGSSDNVSYSKTISIDPELGIIVGSLDKAIDYDESGSAVVNIFESAISTNVIAQVKTIAEAKDAVVEDDEDIISLSNLSPNFWIDLDGSVFMRGTIYAVGGMIDMSQVSIEGGVAAADISGTLNATKVKLENTYGGVGVRSNQGAILYAVNTSVQAAGDYQNVATNYFLATNSSVRMQAGNSAAIEIVNSGNKITLSGNEIIFDAPTVELQNGVAVMSDRKAKCDITYDLSRYDKLCEGLKPAFYHMNDGSTEWHMGFVANDIKDTLLSIGLTENDFAGLVVSGDGDDIKYSLRYNEFVPLNTYMIQKLSERIKVLEEQLRGMNGGNL